MRSALLALTLAAIATLACKKEDTTTPAEGEATTATASEGEGATTEPAEAPAESDGEALEVCTHMGKLMQADLAGTMELTDEQVAESATQCAAELETKRATMPAEEWQTKRSCVMAAQTFEAVNACG